jgi:hypothetical protein
VDNSIVGNGKKKKEEKKVNISNASRDGETS